MHLAGKFSTAAVVNELDPSYHNSTDFDPDPPTFEGRTCDRNPSIRDGRPLKCHYSEVINLLVSNGADVALQNKDGRVAVELMTEETRTRFEISRDSYSIHDLKSDSYRLWFFILQLNGVAEYVLKCARRYEELVLARDSEDR